MSLQPKIHAPQSVPGTATQSTSPSAPHPTPEPTPKRRRTNRLPIVLGCSLGLLLGGETALADTVIIVNGQRLVTPHPGPVVTPMPPRVIRPAHEQARIEQLKRQIHALWLQEYTLRREIRALMRQLPPEERVNLRLEWGQRHGHGPREPGPRLIPPGMPPHGAPAFAPHAGALGQPPGPLDARPNIEPGPLPSDSPGFGQGFGGRSLP